MTRIEGRADDVAGASAERTVERTMMLVLTLIVTTAIAAFAVYVLGSAMLDSGMNGSAHRAAVAATHDRA